MSSFNEIKRYFALSNSSATYEEKAYAVDINEVAVNDGLRGELVIQKIADEVNKFRCLKRRLKNRYLFFCEKVELVVW